MSSLAPGNNTFAVEVTNISQHGIWLFMHDKEVFMPYEDFPWFKEQPIKSVLNVIELSPDHYYWPDIDIDLTREIIENPDNYPFVSFNQ